MTTVNNFIDKISNEQTALLPAQVCHHLGVVGAQERQVAHLPKVHFDGHELAVHVDVLDASRQTQPTQLFRQTGAHRTPEVGIVNSRCFHCFLLCFAVAAHSPPQGSLLVLIITHRE